MRTEEGTKVGQTDGKAEGIVSSGEMKENEAEEKPNPSHSTPENLSEDKTEEELYRSLAITRSKICKRNVVSHEVSAGKLGGEALYCLLQPMAFDFWDKELLLPFKIDSTCFLAMLNNQIQMKNMLLMNSVAAFKEELLKISCMFPRARITVGHILGDMNPADSLTKLYKDPVSAINSMIYRFGPKIFGFKTTLEDNVVATCEDGVFTYL